MTDTAADALMMNFSNLSFTCLECTAKLSLPLAERALMLAVSPLLDAGETELVEARHCIS